MLSILHTESSLGWGGQEIRIVIEITALQKKGYKIALAAPKEAKIYHEAQRQNIKVFDLSLNKRSLRTTFKLRKLIKKYKFDIVNSHSSRDSWHAALAKSISKKKFKLIRTRHLSTKITNNIFNKFLYNSPEKIITTGEKIRHYIIEELNINPERIISIPTGIDINYFNHNAINIPSKGNTFYVSSISILRSWKGIDFLIKAANKLKKKIGNIRFLIVGDGPQKENLELLAKKLNLENILFFYGYQRDIRYFLALSDCIVHPSTGHEGVPQTILQALAMKKPVIATNVGSIPEVIYHKKTGLLIEPKNVDAIVESILFLNKNPSLAQKLGENGRKLVEEKYSLDKMVEKIEKIYQELINS